MIDPISIRPDARKPARYEWAAHDAGKFTITASDGRKNSQAALVMKH
jgi:hypothetical protein